MTISHIFSAMLFLRNARFAMVANIITAINLVSAILAFCFLSHLTDPKFYINNIAQLLCALKAHLNWWAFLFRTLTTRKTICLKHKS